MMCLNLRVSMISGKTSKNHTLGVKISTMISYKQIRHGHTPGVKFSTARISFVEVSNWTWFFHTPCLNIPTTVTSSVEDLIWIEHDIFTPMVWQFPLLWFLLLKLWIGTNAFASECENFHTYDFLYWSLKLRIELDAFTP